MQTHQVVPEQHIPAEIHTTNSPIHILRLPQLMLKVGMSRSWFYEQVRQGTFPAPIKLGGRSVAWIESEIDQWMAEQITKFRNVNGGA